MPKPTPFWVSYHKKYRLSTIQLDYLRMIELVKFYKVLNRVKTLTIAEHRGIWDAKIAILRTFANSAKPYS